MSNNLSKFSVGVVDAPGLTSALNAFGIPAISGATFRIAAEAVQAELTAITASGQSTAIMPVVVMDTHFPGKRIWTSRNSTSSSILILRTGGEKVIGPIPSTEELDLPATVNDILQAIMLPTVPGGDVIVQRDGTIVGATLPEAAAPAAAPVIVPPMSSQVSTVIAQAIQPPAPAAPAPLLAAVSTPMQPAPANDDFEFPPAALPSWIPAATLVQETPVAAPVGEFSTPVFDDAPPAEPLGDYPDHVMIDDSGLDLEAESDRFLLPEPVVTAPASLEEPQSVDDMRLFVRRSVDEPVRSPAAATVIPVQTAEARREPQPSVPVRASAAPFPTTPVVAPVYTPEPADAFEELLTPASPASAVPAVFPSAVTVTAPEVATGGVDELEQWIASGNESAIPALPKQPVASAYPPQVEWLNTTARQAPAPQTPASLGLPDYKQAPADPNPVQQPGTARYGSSAPAQAPSAAPQGYGFGIPAAPASPVAHAADYLPQPFAPERQDTEQVLFVMSYKGGVGKTSSALAIAQRAAARGLRVVLVDMNRGQGDIRRTLRMGADPVASIYDFAVSGDPERAVLSPEMINQRRHPTMPPIRFGVVLAPEAEYAEKEMVPASAYSAMIAFCRAHADLVVVDTQSIEAHDYSGLIDDVLLPHLRAGAFCYLTTDLSSNGLSNNRDWLAALHRDGQPTSDHVVTILNDRSPSNDFTDQDINTFAAEFQRYSRFIGVIGFAPDFANRMNVGIVPGDDEIWSPILDKALLHVTGRIDFQPRVEEPRKRSLFGRKGKRR